jgi:hypothetical protein
VEFQRKLKRKRERNYGGGVLSDALLRSGELIAKKVAWEGVHEHGEWEVVGVKKKYLDLLE